MIEEHIDIQKGLRAALDNLQSYVYIKDRESRYIYANKMTLELFGCSADDLYLTSDEQYFPADVTAKLKEVDQRVLDGESTEEEIIVDDESGRRVYLEAKTPLYSDLEADKIIGILGISTDITYQKSLEEQALKLAKTDVLTGLSNRLEIDSVLSGEIERLKRFPVRSVSSC
jgi:PAS domain S-box-containing protein